MWWWKQSDKQREREREEKERQEKERQEKERQEKEEQERRERAKRKKEKRKKRAQQRRARREEKARQHYVLGGKWCPWQDDLLLLATQSDLHLFSIPEAPSRPQSPDFLEQQPGQRSRLEPGRSRWIGDVSDLSVLRPDELLRVKRIGGYVNSKPGPRCTFDWCPRKTEGRLVVANFGTATTFIKSLIEEETPGTAELSAALSVHNRGYCTSTEWNTLRDQIALGYSRDSRRSILVWDPRRYEAQLPDLARLRMATGTARQFTISSRTGRHRPVALQELGNGHGCRDTKWSPAKSHSLFAAMTNAVSVFDLRMGKEAYKWRMSDAERIAINPYDENMMAVARQGCIHVFDVRRWRSPAICEISASPGQAIVDLHFSPTRSDLLCFLETGSPWIHTANVFRSSMREIFAAPEKKHHTYAHDIGANFSALSCHPRHKARVAAIAREGFVTDTVLHPANVTIQSPNGYFLRTDENMFGFALSRAGSIGTEERFAGVDTQVTTVVPEEDMMVRRLLPRPKPLRGAGKTGKVIGDRPSGKDVEAPQAPNKALQRVYEYEKQFMRTYNADAPEEAYEQLLHRLLDMPIAEEEIFEDAATRRLMERLMVPLPRPPRRLLDGGDDDDDDDDESDEDDDDLLFEYDAADDTWVSQDDDVPVDFAIEMGDFDEEDNSYADTISSAFDSVRHGVAGGGGSIADRGDTRDNNDNNDDDGGDDDDDNDDDDGGGDDDDDDDDDDDYDDDDDDDDYDFDGEGSQPHGRRGAGGVRTKRRSKIFQPRPKSQAKVSFPPTDPAVRMSYIGARMYDRLVRGYSNSARRNMKITCDDWEVHAVWEWLVAQERKGVMGKSAPVSIRDVLAANSQWLYRHAPGFVHPNATQVTMSTGQVLCDHAPQRLLSLALCGWFPPRGADRYSPAPINARLKELLQLGCIGRAASFLAFHNRLDHALIVLTSLEPKPCNDLFILCGTALQAASDEDIPAVAARMERVVKDPYLLAMLQLLADQQRACEAVTKNKEMHVADRAAFLLRFQDDTLALEAQLEAITNEMITGGFLHGLIFTGVSDASIELLQQFLDRTHDLQTVCLVAAHCIGRPPHILSGGRKKHVLTDDRTDEWFDEYRDLLDRWQMFSHRAEFDSLITKVVDTRSGAAPPRSVVLRCQHCNKCMAGARRLRTVRAVLKRNCQECHAPLQTCVVCATRMTINAVATGSFDVGSRHGREGQAPLAPAMFTWCQVCGHGGHANHLLQWFSANTTCAAAECNCKCIVNDTTTIQRQARVRSTRVLHSLE